MKPWAKALVSFAILGLLLVLLPWSELGAAASNASWSVWSFVLLGFIGGHLLGVAKWRMLVNASGASLLPVAAIRYYAAGLFANLCLPSIVGGDVLRAALAGKATGRLEVVVLAGLADRLIDVASLAVFIVGAGFLMEDLATAGSSRMLVISVIASGSAGLLALPFVLRMPLRRWPRKLRRKAGRFAVALRSLRSKPSAAVGAILLSLLIQGSFVLLNAWLAASIGIEVPWITWFLVWPLAKFSGLIPISLGGLGVRDGALAALLVPFGVPAAQGFVVSLLWQSVLIAGGLLSGALWWYSRSSDEASSPQNCP